MSENLSMEFWDSAAPALMDWYEANKRDLPWRNHPTAYETWISEVMLQQTRVEAVKQYYLRFIEVFPDVKALANASEDALLKLWEGLGYYSRARNLQKAAVQMMSKYGGVPSDYDKLLTLPGIGAYTAGAIASISFGLPVPAVDGNVLRVFSRCRNDDGDIAQKETKERVTQTMQHVLSRLASGSAGLFNQALMELGATVCVPNGPPKCSICPWQSTCAAKLHGTALRLPIKTPKKPRRIESWAVLLLGVEGQLAFEKRARKGLLSGLWGLPMVPGELSQTQLIAAVRAMGLEPLQVHPLGFAKHIFTHVEWHMQGYRVAVQEPSPPLIWLDPYRLDEQAVPSAFRYFLPQV